MTLISRPAAFFYSLCHVSVQCGVLVKQEQSHFHAKIFRFRTLFYPLKAIILILNTILYKVVQI